MEDLEVAIVCPFCATGVALLKVRKKILTRRAESHLVDCYYYRCPRCKEEFTTTASDEATLDQLPN